MSDENEFVYIACETLKVLEYCDKSFINKIPIEIINKLKSIEKHSSVKNIKIYKNKKIYEQDISDDAKNFIALLYYNYVASVDERKDILNIWMKNDNIINKEINTGNLFETRSNLNEIRKVENNIASDTEIVVYKKNIFEKISEKIKRLFNK